MWKKNHLLSYLVTKTKNLTFDVRKPVPFKQYSCYYLNYLSKCRVHYNQVLKTVITDLCQIQTIL